MKARINKFSGFWGIFFICFITFILLSTPASSEEAYVFERMWPTLQQPWYFFYPGGLTINASGNVYITDSWNHRIQKFTSDGQFITKWGSEGSGNCEFDHPGGIAVDNSGYVYVADSFNFRIQKFTTEGQFVDKWGSWGNEDGEFNVPYGIAVDTSGYVYVADTLNDRIQKFTSDGQFLTRWGSLGSEAGMFSWPRSLALDSSGRIFVCEYGNNRIQVFSTGAVPSPGENINKAIIIAGGGPFTGNNIWEATEMCANYAYRALTYQGFTKDTIYYLSSDTDLDLDGNGILDDVDADATNTNFEYAITTWAQDAQDLFIYMVDHGGDGTFRTGELEILTAEDLDTWLDTIQAVSYTHLRAHET